MAGAMIRTLTKKNVRRYVDENFDLDLTYVLRNVIVMGFPAEKLESMYRNHIDSVVKFLDEKHKDHYKVYNLCAEKTYPSSKFHYRVAHFPIENGVPPPPELMRVFCEDVGQWLSHNKTNVAVIHAVGNKIRTCVMVCCVMLYQKLCKRAEDALLYYRSARTTGGTVLKVPSQWRYVKYFEELISRKLVYKPHTLLLTKVQIDTIPRMSSNTCCPSFAVYRKNVTLFKSEDKLGVRAHQDVIVLGEDLKVPVCGDLKIEFYHRVQVLNTRSKMFQMWFNTFFVANLIGGDTRWVANNSGEIVDNKVIMLTLKKQELDKAADDNTNKFFSPNLKVRLYFTEMDKLLTPLPTEEPMQNPFRDSEIYDATGLSDSDNESDFDREEAEDRNLELSEDNTDHTPAEILARGQAALQAYREAILSGKKAVYRTRLMFVGQERVGKTSLKKRLMGERFDADEVSTDGIEASSECLIDIRQSTSWSAQPETQDPADTFTSAVAEHMAKQLKEQLLIREGALQEQPPDDIIIPIQEETVSAVLEPSSSSASNEESISDSKKEDQSDTELVGDDDQGPSKDEEKRLTSISSSESEDIRDSSMSLAHIPISVPDTVSKALAGKLGDETEDNSNTITFSLWDFAGQELYYTTHQVFLSRRTIYLVVVNLMDDFSKTDQAQDTITALDRLDFWLQSIYTFAVGSLADVKVNSDRDQLSPPIIIVGTHKGSLGQTTEDREQTIDDKFEAIRDSLQGKCYREHVVNEYFAVENSLEEDESIVDLRRKILAVMEKEPYMGEEIPLRWLQFEDSVKDAVKQGYNSMSVDEVQNLDGAKDIPLAASTELTTMLQFYHDLGAIMYHPKAKSSLQTLVILNPHWLIDVFRSVITVLDRKQQRAVDMKTWELLSNEGILEDRLINLMWKDFIGDDEETTDKKSALLELMEKYDLLVPQCLPNEQGANRQETRNCYYVPSRLQEVDCDGDGTSQNSDSNQSSTVFYIDFNGFLPIGFFHRIMARAVHWSQKQGGLAPKLLYRRATFFADDYHNFRLEMSSRLQSMIEVVISPEEVYDDTEARRADVDPVVCRKVKDFLTDTLQDLKTTWACGITYTFCVACPCGIGDQHFLDLEQCLSKSQPSAIVQCSKRKSIGVKKFLRRFCQERNIKEHVKKLDAHVETNLLKKYDLPSFLGGVEETYQEVSSPSIPFDLFTKLCTLLTPKQSLGNDWRMLASRVGLDLYISYLESRFKEPTAVVLRYCMERGQSLEELKDILKSMSRGDVASELETTSSSSQ